MAKKDFNASLSQWLNDFYTGMQDSADKRADMNEVIVNGEYDNALLEIHSELIKENLTNLVSLYHIINRCPSKFQSLIAILTPEKNE